MTRQHGVSTAAWAGPEAEASDRWRFWIAATTAAATAVALAVGITTPPRSGPNCRHGCIAYPYTGGREFVPRDFLWFYPASVAVVLALAFVICVAWRPGRPLHPGAELAARVAVCLAAIAAGVLVTDYGMQLTLVQAALSKGESDGLGLVSQYNPHGVFIALENVGYLMLGVALAGAGAAMAVRSRTERAARVVLLTAGGATLVALVGYAAVYGTDLEYRFEVAGIAITWLALITAGALVALGSRARTGRGGAEEELR